MKCTQIPWKVHLVWTLHPCWYKTITFVELHVITYTLSLMLMSAPASSSLLTILGCWLRTATVNAVCPSIVLRSKIAPDSTSVSTMSMWPQAHAFIKAVSPTCVCVCVCVYLHVYVREWVCVCVHVYNIICVCVHVHTVHILCVCICLLYTSDAADE